jgi:hypothetical protein
LNAKLQNIIAKYHLEQNKELQLSIKFNTNYSNIKMKYKNKEHKEINY